MWLTLRTSTCVLKWTFALQTHELFPVDVSYSIVILGCFKPKEFQYFRLEFGLWTLSAVFKVKIMIATDAGHFCTNTWCHREALLPGAVFSHSRLSRVSIFSKGGSLTAVYCNSLMLHGFMFAFLKQNHVCGN